MTAERRTANQWKQAGDDPLRGLLARRLRRERWGKLYEGEAEDYSRGAELVSIGFLASVLLGLVVFAVARLGWPPWLAIGALMVAMVVAALVARATGALILIYLTFVATWAVAGVTQMVGDGTQALVTTHALPGLVVVAGLSAWRSARLVASIPVVLPVALGIVLIPLLTEDPWAASSAAGSRLWLFAGLTIAPLLTLALIRQLKVPVAPAFRAAADRLSDASRCQEGQSRAPEERAVKLLGRLNRDEVGLDEDKARRRLRRAYESPFPAERAPDVAATIGRRFRWQVGVRVVLLTLGTAAAVGTLVYVLAWTVIPTNLAERWAGRRVPLETLEVLGVGLSVPLGPYVAVAALLGIIATGGFLAFALTEDRYSTAMADALMNRPAERCLLLALAFAVASEGGGRRRRGGRRSRRRASNGRPATSTREER